MVSVDRDQALREFILLKSDYWVQHVTGTRTPDGRITYKVQFVPSGFARRFRMLAHFRCLDRDDD